MEGFFDWDLISKLLLATFLGSTIGLERYVHGRPAGFRTYLLVCVAFTSIAILSEKLSLGNEALSVGSLRFDPGRLVAGGLTGIGFLGAGIIIRGGSAVHGLTTAAGIWAISVVGLAVGFGYDSLGVALCVIILLTLFGLRYIEQGLRKDIYKFIELSVRNPGIRREFLEDLLRGEGLRIIAIEMGADRTEHVHTYKFTLNGRTEQSFYETFHKLARLEGVQSIHLTGHTLGTV